MSGKGSGRRPLKVTEASFADNWSRIFGSDGARVGANDGSNPSNVGAIPTAPAIYIDDATGK